MQLRNIRPNFSEMTESDRHDFFWRYADSRDNDFKTHSLVEVKLKKTKNTGVDGAKKKKEEKLKVTPAQLALLKTLGLC